MDVSELSKRQLFEDAGEAYAALLHCLSRQSILASHHSPHPSFSWGLVLACGKCSTQWVVCTLCFSMWKHMIENSSDPQWHNKTKHGGMTTKRNLAQINALMETTQHLESSTPWNLSHTASPPQQFPLDFFLRPKNCKFFKQQATGYGIGYLVGLANFGEDKISKLVDPRRHRHVFDLGKITAPHRHDHNGSSLQRPYWRQFNPLIVIWKPQLVQELHCLHHLSHLISQPRHH